MQISRSDCVGSGQGVCWIWKPRPGGGASGIGSVSGLASGRQALNCSAVPSTTRSRGAPPRIQRRIPSSSASLIGVAPCGIGEPVVGVPSVKAASFS